MASRATLPGLVGSKGRGETGTVSAGGGVELVGADRVQAVFRDLQGRFVSQTKWLAETAMPVLQAGEESIFDSWAPRFDSSLTGSNSSGLQYGTQQRGQLRASLTDAASPGTWESFGPVRWVGDHALIFGTSIFYARFQRAIGGPSGKPRGRVRTGPSLVLATTPEELEAILNLAAGYFWGPLVELEGGEQEMAGPLTYAGAA